MTERLSREKLEEFLKEIGGTCIVTEERDRYFILSCSKRGKYGVQKRIVEELGFPASIISKNEIYVYRFKPEARARVEVSWGSVRERLDPNDKESVFEYSTPKLCLTGNTYPAKEVLKGYGFKFEPFRKAWCRSFSTFSEMIDFVKSGLPQLVADAASKGVSIEVNSDELEKEIDRIRNDLSEINATNLESFLFSYVITKAKPEILEDAARVAGEEDTARRVEEIARAFDEFGDSVEVFASLPPASHGIAVCVRPRKYLGRDLFKAFMERVKSLGLKKVGSYTYCETIASNRTAEILKEATKAFATIEARGHEEAVDRATEWLKQKGIEVDRSDVENLVNKLRTTLADIVNKAKSLIYRALS